MSDLKCRGTVPRPCTTYVGPEGPHGITLSKQDNLIVSEKGTPTPNTGRISIVSLSGTRRTLLDGLPSGASAEGEGDPSGPAGLFLRGRTLYLAIGVGDAVLNGANPGTEIPNPNPSSPLLSSILAIEFSVDVEAMTTGFTLTSANQQTLASGQAVTLSHGGGQTITIRLIANFPNYTPDPRPDFPANVRNSNPFALVAVGNQLYVTDGGQNTLRQVDLTSGEFSTLATFPPIPNPTPIGAPVIDVPTGIVYSDGKLLVTLFRGFPFLVSSSVVEQVDPVTGSEAVY